MRLSLATFGASGALAVLIWALMGPPESSGIQRLPLRHSVITGF